MSTSIKIFRDHSDFPCQVVVTKGGRRYTVSYDRNREIVFDQTRIPSDVIELLKLVYPFSEKTKLEEYRASDIIHANGTGNNAHLAIYTVPAEKELLILSGHLTTFREGAGASPMGTFHVYAPSDSYANAHTFIYHSWDYVANEVLSDHFSCDIPFPSGWRVAAFANADATVYYSFIGALRGCKN